ncbi:DNA-packaging protein [Elizabethkingia anophelis]|uniref:DNA-packaging protein n=1 Tax=Elizabethkingia anophelis TaxID=1117645 RepID=UPI0020111AFD|nr:DNA-packaging protein [Elizabethkingia anophelis]MCL1690852.1 DNA-packaging protein [Elizabethkingia anophelis]
MAAPKGNNYWQFRNKHGRDFKYDPNSFWDEAVKYFEWMQDNHWNIKEPIKSGNKAGTTMNVPTQTPMSIDSFCLFVDIDDNTFFRYEKEKGYEDFWDVTKTIRKIIESQQFEGVTVGVFRPNIIARKLGLDDNTNNSGNGDNSVVQRFSVEVKRSSAPIAYNEESVDTERE